ncbi:MAG: hydroxylamine reductase [Candidatus Omnitrophota bacterium]
MFCRQCEQAAHEKGCTVSGICGKAPETADLQDLLIRALIGVAVYGKLLRGLGVKNKGADLVLIEGLFSTVTNVDFDPASLEKAIRKACATRNALKALFFAEYKKTNGREFSGTITPAAEFTPAADIKGLAAQAAALMATPPLAVDKDIASLREILLYGLKGMAAYADHALILEAEDEEVNSFLYKGLSALVDDSLTADHLVALIMEFGKTNLKCMEILDGAHTKRLGHPVPTKVTVGVKKGPAIIVSGHDLHDLEELLRQTEGAGVNVYTHSEMLPAHGYPALNKYPHLAGHFGTAWQNQQAEFDGVPAAILMTTNCIQKPRPSYKDRIFTTGLVEWPGVAHINAVNGKKDFGAIIRRSKELGGFKSEEKSADILVGFGHNAVLGAAPKVIEAVKAGKIRHFFLIGGCDGAKPGRNYYTEFAEKVPADCMILTLACGKFRFNTHDFGTIDGLPRLLDVGQCNDAYSAIKIAVALAGAFKCDVNELPLSLVLSWYEQKAVCILLTLFSLGIKNIRLGPTLPAFISPNVLKILVDTFAVKPITNPDDDLKAILKK